jgi:hypothetical protein
MKVRVILACTLLLLAAVPSFALPLCEDCNEWNQCEARPGATLRCSYDINGNCYNYISRCAPPPSPAEPTGWKVVSIEIHRPSLDSVTITAPALKAEVPEQARRTTELK